MKKIFFILLLCTSFSSAMTVSVNVPEKYQEVSGGERLYFELTLKYPENPDRVDLRLEYKVLDSNGNLVTQSKGIKAVETQASFLEWIILPEKMDLGRHTISIDIKDYGDLSKNVQESFSVSKNRMDTLFLYIYVLSAMIIIMMGLIIFILLRGNK